MRMIEIVMLAVFISILAIPLYLGFKNTRKHNKLGKQAKNGEHRSLGDTLFRIVRGILAVFGVTMTMFIIVAVVYAASNPTSPTQADNATQEQKQVEAEDRSNPTEEKYQNWIKYQFDVWDGSHRKMKEIIKERMNDPRSFEHVKTSYIDNGDNTITIHMTFRGNNAFGAKVIQEATGKAEYKTNYVKIVNLQ